MEGHVLHGQPAQHGALGQVGHAVQRQIGLYILQKNAAQPENGGQVPHLLQALLEGGLQKVLLDLDTADVSALGIVVHHMAVDQLVVLAPAEKLHGLVAV